MTAQPKAWDELVAALAPQMPPEWTKRAREDADQAWIRLILLVDAQHRLSAAGIDEKIATTMAELAEDREAERRGWTVVMERAREEREERLGHLLDVAPQVLPSEQLPLFQRSIEPLAPGMSAP
jgi:hypothetical protein